MEQQRFVSFGYLTLQLNKWILPSNIEVEKTLFQHYSTFPSPASTPGCSYILDVGDQGVRELFSDAEWRSIINSYPPASPYTLSPLADEYLRISTVVTLDGLTSLIQAINAHIGEGARLPCAVVCHGPSEPVPPTVTHTSTCY